MARSRILHGDCLSRLRSLPANSVDSLVTDPPAGISFMGKDWDHHKGGRDQWIAWLESVMRECLRVLKPGAHGLVWALPRTSHWTATALENAGFEVRDVVTHLFGSGFPKSLDVSKAIDRAAGAEREAVAKGKAGSSSIGQVTRVEQGARPMIRDGSDFNITVPATDAAKRWQGFGTALKPASEHWILVRKPCSEKTVAANVLRWGTGALAIDASRIGTEGGTKAVAYAKKSCGRLKRWDEGSKGARNKIEALPLGRWPANLVLSPDAAEELDRQSGTLKSGKLEPHHKDGGKTVSTYGKYKGRAIPPQGFGGDSGGASRFFYVAKPSRRERNLGCEGMERRDHGTYDGGADRNGERKLGRKPAEPTSPVQNTHPTIKPIALMRYLIRTVTPPGGLVLDCFLGSGTTGAAAKKEGFRFLGIEQSAEYVAISKARIKAA